MGLQLAVRGLDKFCVRFEATRKDFSSILSHLLPGTPVIPRWLTR